MKTLASFSLLILLVLCVGLPAALGNGEYRKCPAHAGSCPVSLFRIGVECIKDMITVECKNDTECAPDEKCCSVPVCTTKCVKIATEKAGVCPKPGFMCDMLPVPRNCSGDSDCLGPQKCCRLPCSIGCTNPVISKPGRCPEDTEICIQMEEDLCKTDIDCKIEDNKCCYNRCGMKCVDAVKVKPGNCPPMNLMCMNTTPKSDCKVDSDCLGKLKCCNRCGMRCVPPK